MSRQQAQQQYYDDQDNDDQQYEFSSKPQAQKPKEKYRAQNDPDNYIENQRGGQVRIQSQTKSNSDQGYNDENQNQNLYEELQDDVEDENSLMVDFYIDRAPTPEYKPKERGVDVSTQIIDQELFDYEIEVEPVLQVLIGKTCDQARMELIEEYEVNELKAHKDQYIKKRNAELLVTQRQENAYIRRKDEKERRILQHKLRRDLNKLVHKKFVCSILSKRGLVNMKSNVIKDLQDQGFLKNNAISNLKNEFMPWLFTETVDLLNQQKNDELDFDKILELYKANIDYQHSKNIIKEELMKKNEIERRRQQQLEKEDRMVRRKEWKRKLALQKERQNKKDYIIKKVISNGQKVDHILESVFNDIFQDGKNQPVAGIFGGILGQLWIVFDVLDKLSIDDSEKLDAQNIHDFLLKFLNVNLKLPFELLIQSQTKQLFEEKLKQFEENPADFNQNKEENLNQIIQNIETFIGNFSLKAISKHLNQNSLKQILKVFLDFLFKVSQPDETDKNKILLDNQLLLAKQKISITYDQNNIDSFQQILRVRVPFYTSEELGIEPQEDEYELEQRAKMKDKYDEFIDIFNGQGYQILRNKFKKFSKRRDLLQEGATPTLLNINLAGGKNWTGYIDERSQFFFRIAVFKLLKEQFDSKLSQIEEQIFIDKCWQIDEQIENEFIKSLPNKEKVALFDYEL